MDKEGKWGKHYPKCVLPLRERRSLHIFDIKSFTEAKHKAKMEEMFGSGGSGNPLMDSPMGTNLFAPSLNSPFPRQSFNPEPVQRKPLDINELTKRIDAQLAKLEEEEQREKEAAKNKEKEAQQIDTKPIEIKEEAIKVDELVDNLTKDKKEETKKVNIPETTIIGDDSEIKNETNNIEKRELEETKNDKKDIKVTVAEPTETGNLVVKQTDIPSKDDQYDENFVTDDQFFDDFFSEDD